MIHTKLLIVVNSGQESQINKAVECVCGYMCIYICAPVGVCVCVEGWIGKICKKIFSVGV